MPSAPVKSATGNGGSTQKGIHFIVKVQIIKNIGGGGLKHVGDLPVSDTMCEMTRNSSKTAEIGKALKCRRLDAFMVTVLVSSWPPRSSVSGPTVTVCFAAKIGYFTGQRPRPLRAGKIDLSVVLSMSRRVCTGIRSHANAAVIENIFYLFSPYSSLITKNTSGRTDGRTDRRYVPTRARDYGY